MTINLKEMEADRKRDRENLKGMMAEISARMDKGKKKVKSLCLPN
jgi:hypothetical protein